MPFSRDFVLYFSSAIDSTFKWINHIEKIILEIVMCYLLDSLFLVLCLIDVRMAIVNVIRVQKVHFPSSSRS